MNLKRLFSNFGNQIEEGPSRPIYYAVYSLLSIAVIFNFAVLVKDRFEQLEKPFTSLAVETVDSLPLPKIVICPFHEGDYIPEHFNFTSYTESANATDSPKAFFGLNYDQYTNQVECKDQFHHNLEKNRECFEKYPVELSPIPLLFNQSVGVKARCAVFNDDYSVEHQFKNTTNFIHFTLPVTFAELQLSYKIVNFALVPYGATQVDFRPLDCMDTIFNIYLKYNERVSLDGAVKYQLEPTFSLVTVQPGSFFYNLTHGEDLKRGFFMGTVHAQKISKYVESEYITNSVYYILSMTGGALAIFRAVINMIFPAQRAQKSRTFFWFHYHQSAAHPHVRGGEGDELSSPVVGASGMAGPHTQPHARKPQQHGPSTREDGGDNAEYLGDDEFSNTFYKQMDASSPSSA